jgi:hypothetical protein
MSALKVKKFKPDFVKHDLCEHYIKIYRRYNHTPEQAVQHLIQIITNPSNSHVLNEPAQLIKCYNCAIESGEAQIANLMLDLIGERPIHQFSMSLAMSRTILSHREHHPNTISRADRNHLIQRFLERISNERQERKDQILGMSMNNTFYNFNAQNMDDVAIMRRMIEHISYDLVNNIITQLPQPMKENWLSVLNNDLMMKKRMASLMFYESLRNPEYIPASANERAIANVLGDENYFKAILASSEVNLPDRANEYIAPSPDPSFMRLSKRHRKGGKRTNKKQKKTKGTHKNRR